MATITTAAEIDIRIKGDGTLKSLKTQIREAKDEAILMARAYGEFSTEALTAAKYVADLKHETESLNKRVSSLSPDKFGNIAKAASTIASGIAAAQGAMSLFGAESEDAEKAMLKVQSAMALSQGLNGLSEAKKDIVDLAKNVAGSLKNAFTTAAGAARALGSALGIGLILIAVSLIVTYWEDIVELMGFGKSEAEKLGDIAKKNGEIEQEKLDALDSQSNVLKMQGLSEKDILNLKREQIKKVIEAAQAELTAAKLRKEEQIASTKRYAGYLEMALKFVSIPITAILKSVDLIGKAFGKDWGLEDKVFKPLANLVFDPEKTEKKGDEVIAKQQAALDKLVNQQAGFELQVLASDKAANDKRVAENAKRNAEIKADNEKAAADEEKLFQARFKLFQEANLINDRAAKENQDRARTDFEIKMQTLAENYVKEKALLEAQLIETAELRKSYETQKTDLELEEFHKSILKDIADGEAEVEVEKAKNAAKLASQLAAAENAYAAANEFSNLIGVLGNNNLKVQKAQAIIQIGIDTASAISSLVRNSEGNPLNLLTGGVAGIAQFATGILRIGANIAKAANLLKAPVNVPTGNNEVNGSLAAQNSNNQQQQQNTKVYVTETDIRTALTRVRDLSKVGVVE